MLQLFMSRRAAPIISHGIFLLELVEASAALRSGADVSQGEAAGS